jgi:DNA-binding FadR family transcriptional regulator
LAEIKKESSSTHKQEFVNSIAGSILSGHFRVGERLPTERELAAQMNISKTVVHSGMETLSHMGLVYIKPQSGIFVADYLKTGNIDTLNAIVKYNGDNLGYEVVSAILDLRLVVEGTAFLRLGSCRTGEQIARLRQLIDEISQQEWNDNNITHIAEMFFQWHRFICIYSGSVMLPLMMNATHDISIAFWIRYIGINGLAAAIERLNRFTDLIEDGDGTGAYDILAKGIVEYLKAVKDI